MSEERKIEILNNIKEYMQSCIDEGYHKFVYNDLGYDEKCIDIINAIDDLLDLYNKIKEKVEELEQDIEKQEKETLGRCITIGQAYAIKVLNELLESEK